MIHTILQAEQLQSVFDSMSVLVALVDRDFVYRSCNNAYAEWFRRAKNEIVGAKAVEVLGEAAFERLQPFFEGAFSGKASEYERWVTYDAPGARYIRVQYLPVPSSGSTSQGCWIVIQDLTEQRRGQERISASERRFKLLSDVSAALNGSLEIDRVLKSLGDLTVPDFADWCSIRLMDDANQLRQVSVSHIDPEKVAYALRLQDKFTPNDRLDTGPFQVLRTGRPELIREVSEDLIVKSAKNLEQEKLMRDLAIRSYICVPIRTRDAVIGTLSLCRTNPAGALYSEDDVQWAVELGMRAGSAVENARLYRQSQNVNRLKDEFLATLSHELRSPINVIQGHADLLMGELASKGNEDVVTSLDAIARNSRLQTQIVSDLLDVSSIVTGKISYRPELLAPGEIAQNVARALRPTAEAKGVILACDVTRAPAKIAADPTRLHQIFWNLATNAVKFTPSGQHVSLSVEASGDDCLIRVVDTGIGIEKEKLPLVFDRFWQADSSVSRHYAGLGLGLSIVRSLVEMHGGDVEVESEGHGKGATFFVRLPVNLASVPAPEDSRELRSESTAGAPKEIASLNAIHGKLILLVDDSDDNLNLVKRFLAKAGADVIEARSAKEARRKLERISPDLILSDIGMPEENGLELLRGLRQAGLQTPAVALTAYVRPEEIEETLAAGFQSHVSKPITMKSLLAGLARALSSDVNAPRADRARGRASQRKF